jgi:hypothetical protein
LARFDGDLKAVGEANVDVDELLSAFPKADKAARQGRQDAMACFLSASEGWEQAKEALKGAFAAAPRASWLRGDKD